MINEIEKLKNRIKDLEERLKNGNYFGKNSEGYCELYHLEEKLKKLKENNK